MEKRNTNTTVLGVLAIVGALLPIAVKLLGGEGVTAADFGVLATVLTGFGLVKAKDA